MAEEKHSVVESIILEKLGDLQDSFNTFREEVNDRFKKQDERLEPLDNLSGFWKVLGFFLGGAALVAAGIAGVMYVIGVLKGFK